MKKLGVKCVEDTLFKNNKIILEELKMAITASMVKELRELSGAGMMDCKKALNETNGNIEEAVDYLRKNAFAC